MALLGVINTAGVLWLVRKLVTVPLRGISSKLETQPPRHSISRDPRHSYVLDSNLD